MKKLVLIMATLLLFVFNSSLKADIYGKQNYVAINPFGLLFHIYSGEYGRFLDAEGKSEINMLITYYDWGDFSYFGVGAKYRMYKDQNGEGIFYGGGLRFSKVNWEWLDESESSTWMTFTPLGEAGYRWTWANGWTIAPSLELGYDISTYSKDSKYDNITTYSEPSTGLSGLHWGLNLGVAYSF